jgi:hypothetical protein
VSSSDLPSPAGRPSGGGCGPGCACMS